MRDATLSGLSDLDAVRPRKPRTPVRKAEPVGKTRSAFATLRRLRSRATLVIASAGFSAIMVGIVCNAVLFQKGHHPSPLFGSSAGEEKPAPVAEARPVARAMAPPPAVAPAAVPETAVADAAPAPAASHRVPVRAAAVPHHPAPKPVRSADAIRNLLAGKSDGTTVAPRPQAAAARKPAPAVAAGAPVPLHPANRTVADAATTARPKVRPGQPASAARKVADAPVAKPAVND